MQWRSQNPYESLLPSLDLLDIRYCRIHSRVKYVSLLSFSISGSPSNLPQVALDGTPSLPGSGNPTEGPLLS